LTNSLVPAIITSSAKGNLFMTARNAQNENQLSFADLGLMDAKPTPKPTPVKKSKTDKRKSLTANAQRDLSDLLAHAERLATKLQDKYEANLEADRISTRIGISVDIEEVESLLLAISKANRAINQSN